MYIVKHNSEAVVLISLLLNQSPTGEAAVPYSRSFSCVTVQVKEIFLLNLMRLSKSFPRFSCVVRVLSILIVLLIMPEALKCMSCFCITVARCHLE